VGPLSNSLLTGYTDDFAIFCSYGEICGLAQHGAALVIVLALVVALSLLIVGLMLNSQSETKISSSQFHALEARLAADSVQHIIEGQVRRATTLGIDSDGKGVFSWASQPGAIRVYDTEGNEHEIYKLYSSASMIAPGGSSLDADIPNTWRDTPDIYVDLNEPVKRGSDWIYPIANPEALGTVAGFSSTLSNTSGSAGPDNRLIMPVRWLYLLQDGTVTDDPEQGDPFIRFAFWTDDESSKINLNTASATDAASYWDIPRATYREERDLYAWCQPAENEFNRYPGHPATVSLQTVFPDLSIKDIIQSTPRYEWGGSQNGSLKVHALAPLPKTKLNRLYATPDEFLLTPQRGSQLSLNGATLDSRRFFLTTNSRSSDLNLFGQPRVTIWPISGIDDDRHRTIYDRAIALNSTLGSGTNAFEYYFVRSNPNSQTDDWTLYPRNRGIFAYLRDLTSRTIPGFGGNFETKYDTEVTGERDQILTEIFDYIRTVNLNETYKTRDDSLGDEKFVSYTNDRPSGDIASDSAFGQSRGAGWVLPIKTPYGRGAGRIPVISEIGLWLIQTQDVISEGTPPNYSDATYADPDPPEVQPGLIIETFSPMQGVMAWVPFEFSYKVRNIVAPTINGQNIFPDDEVESTYKPPGGSYARSQDLGGTDGFGWLMSGGMSSGVPNHMGINPFLRSKPKAITLPPGATSLTITAGEIEISFMTSPNHKTKGQGTVFQTYRISIPQTTVPVPTPVQPMRRDDRYDLTSRNGWWQRKPDDGSPPQFGATDVVRGLAIKHGDYRTEAYLEDVPKSFFQETFQDEYGFRNAQRAAFLGTKNGSYVSNLHYPTVTPSLYYDTPRPKIPAAINGLIEEGWDADFDNGLSNHIDGPYLNKSDEGALWPNSTGNKLPYYYGRSYLAEGLFSPFRQVPSAVVFGSLPTGVKQTEAGIPILWRTLAFSPNPLSGSSHYGLIDPPDHLLLDLFTMPIVEPYAISEPFSTAGRLNMNHQIVPFSHITRKTALHAALASQKIIAIADADVGSYKNSTSPNSYKDTSSIRFAINAEETLKSFDAHLAAKKQNLFRSATEICDIHLVPVGRTAANVAAWWNDYRLTGNNSREKPYASLYPLLTTKSNVFTAHIRAQSIKRTPSGKFTVRSEYRGSVLFERYLDPKDQIFSDGSVDPDQVSLEPHFRFRTLISKQFDP